MCDTFCETLSFSAAKEVQALMNENPIDFEDEVTGDFNTKSSTDLDDESETRNRRIIKHHLYKSDSAFFKVFLVMGLLRK